MAANIGLEPQMVKASKTTEIYTLSLHDALPIWVDSGH